MKVAFELGDIVYLKTDPDQYARIVTGIIWRSSGFEYALSLGSEPETWHHDIEITVTKNYELENKTS